MSGYILNLPEDEGVVVSGQAARRLVEGGDGDAALLYIAVLRNRGNMDEGKLAGQLGWPEGRLRQALGSLVRQGLAAPPAREAAADAPIWLRQGAKIRQEFLKPLQRHRMLWKDR